MRRSQYDTGHPTPTPPEQEEPVTPEEPPVPEIEYTDTLESTFCHYYYWGNIGNDSDNVVLELGDVTFDKIYGYINGVGTYIALSLSVPHLEDYNDAGIIAGKYTFDSKNTFDPMTVATESCYSLYEIDEYGYASPVEAIYFDDVIVSIEQNADGYDLHVALFAKDGKTILVTYSGEVDFQNKYADMLPPAIDKDMNFTCSYGELEYHGDAYYKIDIMANDPYAGQYPSWGDMDRLNIFLTATEDDPTGIPSGTYEVGKEGPGGVVPGEYVFDGYTGYNYGSYYFFMDTSVYEETVGYFASGTVTVERDGENYMIAVDVVSENGYTIKSTYEGIPVLHTMN